MAAAKKKKKSAAEKTKKAPAKRTRSLDRLGRYADDLRGQVGKQVDRASALTYQQTARLAVTLIDLQKKTFDTTLDAVTRVQERSEKALNDYLKGASWMPKEGKEVVREWSRALKDGRAEFHQTMDKSYDLLGSYFKRLDKEVAKKVPAKPAKKKAPAKKKTPAKSKVEAAKKRAGAKKKAKKKAAAK